MSEKYLLSIDQGTTSTRVIIFDEQGMPVVKAHRELDQHYPELGWVEHDPEQIWQDVLSCCQDVLINLESCVDANDSVGSGPVPALDGVATQSDIQESGRVCPDNIAGIGITNQRETTIVWDKKTGKPIYNAIVWQDRRTAPLCTRLKADGHEAMIQAKTGLLLDPYFSATKLHWLLNHIDGAREKAEKGELCFGTVDSFILFRLTGGKVHATDATNASRTMLFNIHTQRWDAELLDLFDIPKAILPEVKDSSADYGLSDANVLGCEIAITAVAGDQQAATIGQACFKPGMIKSTYGTGGFLMLNTGEKPVVSKNRLLTTVAYRLNGKVTYALEGSIFIAGAVIQWLRDNCHFFNVAAESEALANSVDSTGGVTFIPAFTGLGAPYWHPEVRGAIVGLTRNTGIAEITRAALEAICFQTQDVMRCMRDDVDVALLQVRVDGGMVANQWLCQALSDVVHMRVSRTDILETTARGVAFLAGLQCGIYEDLAEIGRLWQADAQFQPAKDYTAAYQEWQHQVQRLID